MPFYFFWDPTYILIIIGLIISGLASWNVNQTFRKYDQYESLQGYTGAQAAEKMLASQGINNVRIARVSGNLSDYYDPSNKVLRLSDSTYDSSSIAAVGVAAHECGHAVQDQQGYAFLRIRNSLVPLVNFGTNAGFYIILFSWFFNISQKLVNIGILLYSLGLLFQLVTLPVEFNASRRALVILDEEGILTPEEVPYARKVLFSAALTYVAAAISSLLSLLRLVLLFGDHSDDN